jgi:hypothetical protein
MRLQIRSTPALLAAGALAFALGGCGSSKSNTSSSSSSPSTAASSSASTATAATQPPAVDELAAAERPHPGQFPAVHGRSLQQLGALVKSSAALGAATGTFTPGIRRFAFALTSRSGAFIYAPTALYIATRPSSPNVVGPILSAADPMGVAPQFRSKQNTGPGGIQAIYSSQVPLMHTGTWTVLALTRTAQGLIGSPGEIAVAPSSPIPDIGQRPPAIATDTLATTHGNVALATTRIPPESMHSVSFNQVLGNKPVALLFSTPQLCISRVCGPVTDIAVELQHTFGNRITFIHQEVYVDNNPSKGLRPQLTAFHLRTEPWLFTINSKGVIVARLEGAFGVRAATKALEAALR